MGRKIMVVTAAYGAEQVRQAGGQRAMLPVIAGAGADGVEIRRELFSSEELLTLPANEVLWRLYHEEEVTLYDPQDVEFKCTCSRERCAFCTFSPLWRRRFCSG